MQAQVAVARAEVVGQAQVILDDRRGDELALVLHRQELVGEQKAAPVALVADDAGDAGHLADEGAFERIGEQEGQVEAGGAQAGGEVEELSLAGLGLGLAGAIGDELVGPGHAGVDRLDVAAHEVTDVRRRV